MPITEPDLHHWIQRVVEGKASRRQFMHTMLGLGLSAPFVANLLASYTPAAAQGARVRRRRLPPPNGGAGADCACCGGKPRRLPTCTCPPARRTTMPHAWSRSH